jgi:HEAT repeat protein
VTLEGIGEGDKSPASSDRFSESLQRGFDRGLWHRPLMPTARERPDPVLVAAIRELLDRIGAAEERENDELEEVVEAAAEEFAALEGPGLVPALLKAAGRSTARRNRAVLLLTARDPDPETIEVMRTWITDPSPDVRSVIIQTIGFAELRALAPLLADRIADEDDLFCRDMAVFAAGKLRADVCLPAILDLVDTDFSRWRLAQALASYATEDVRPYLARWFEDEGQPHEVRLQAAWGLGKLGEERAVDYLAECLLTPQGTDRFRCAQAICEINGWPFEWHLRHVERTAERVRAERAGNT